MEDYVQARELAVSESLTSMANDYRRVFKPLSPRTTVPELVVKLLAARKQDGTSKAYVANPTAIYGDGVFQPDTEKFLLMRFASVPKTFEFQLCRINGIRRALITELANVMQAEPRDQGWATATTKRMRRFA